MIEKRKRSEKQAEGKPFNIREFLLREAEFWEKNGGKKMAAKLRRTEARFKRQDETEKEHATKAVHMAKKKIIAALQKVLDDLKE